MKRKNIDVLTTSVPRATTEESISSLFTHFKDRDKFYLRWIINLDPVENLMDYYEETVKQINKMGQFFDEVHFIKSKEANHYNAILRLLKISKYDVILWEDDRICSKDLYLERIYLFRNSFTTFLHRKVHVGSLSPCHLRRDAVEKMVECLKKGDSKHDPEGWMVYKLWRCSLKYGRGRYSILSREVEGNDIGRKMLQEIGLIRTDKRKTRFGTSIEYIERE